MPGHYSITTLIIVNNPSSCPLWLATSSPRRYELLQQAGFAIAGQATKPEVDERLRPEESARQACLRLAKAKYRAAARIFDFADNRVLLAADTLVADPDGQPLGKPKTHDEARSMLKRLSGQVHAVYTAVTLGNRQLSETILASAWVEFIQLDEHIIESYIATGEPFDKAGGYGLQGFGGVLVREIRGETGTVVGWPLCQGTAQLAGFGVYPNWLAAVN